MKRLICTIASLILFFSIPAVVNNYPYPSPVKAYAISDEEKMIVKAVERVNSSVVTIIGESTGEKLFRPSSILMNFLNIVIQSHEKDDDKTISVGSGVILNKKGIIITNKHVVSEEKTKYFVVLPKTEERIPVTKLEKDPNRELAVLHINRNNLKETALGDSDNVRIGQIAIAIGSVFGDLRNTVTVGHISGLNRNITVRDPTNGQTDHLNELIQTDAALNFGNSGGALINSDGEIIGITTATSRQNENIGFAIPINEVKNMLADYKRFGKL